MDSFEKGLQALLLFNSQFFHLFHKTDLKVLLTDFSFSVSLLLDHSAHSLGLVIILYREVDLLLLAHLNERFAVTLFSHELSSDFLLVEEQLLLLLVLELLNQFKCSSFVISHILVPSLREFLKLKLLCIFDIEKLLLLGEPHVLILTLLFSFTEFFKLKLHHFSSTVISTGLSINSKLVHDPIFKDIYASVRESMCYDLT